MAGADSVPEGVYFYNPNKAAAIFFTLLFASSCLAHLWQCFSSKSFQITGLLVFGCALVAAGFSTRIYLADHVEDGQVFTASTLLLYVAPPVFQLANFQILGRLFHFVPYFAPMHPARMLLTFISIGVVIELLTVMGVAFLSNRNLPEKSLRMGDYMIKASLIAQIIVLALFSLLVGIFHYCCRSGSITAPRVTRLLAALYTSMALILGRTVYRMVEHFSIPPNPLSSDPSSASPTVRYESYFYVFDAALVFLASLLWNIWHPRLYLPADCTKYLAQDGKTELKGPGWKDTRSLTETFLDPFAALTARGGHQKPFWEHNGYALRRMR